jgi:hypothetical protein
MAEHQRSSLTMRTACFAAAHLEATARRTGFVNRASNMTGTILLALVTFGAWSEATTPVAPLAATVTQWDEHVAVSPEAMEQRLPKRAQAFRPEMLQQALAKTPAIEHGGAEVCCAALTTVSRADRPGCELPDRLKDTCAGSGGSAAKAGATMQAVWDDTNSRVDHCALTAWTMPDQQDMDQVAAWAQKGLVFLFA